MMHNFLAPPQGEVMGSDAATSFRGSALIGTTTVPGDKSISHRALLLASQVIGTTTIQGLLLGDDVLRTATAIQILGAQINLLDHGIWEIKGVGIGGFQEPENIIDMGNSGTGARLLIGLLATHPFMSVVTGDQSLRSRPMARVAKPLEQMGAKLIARSQCRLPLAVQGAPHPMPITYRLPVPSAQIKSAILLAGLNTPGKTTIIEPEATRDHTEKMLQYFGVPVTIESAEDGSRVISLSGHGHLSSPGEMVIPGDPSSAAFLIVAALITPDSDLTISNICINPLRTGLFKTLQEMGADLCFINPRMVCGEQVADIRVRYSQLKGIAIPAERAPSMIDEYPILSIAAICAKGATTMEGLAELKVKESNRLSAIAKGLHNCGIRVTEGEDSLIIEGSHESVKGGVVIETFMDHRIAMSFLVLGLISKEGITIDNIHMIQTSFPGFVTILNQLGGCITLPSVSL